MVLLLGLDVEVVDEDDEADEEQPLSTAAPSTTAARASVTARGDPSRALVGYPAMSEGP
jgi:hypothetical protein